MEFYAIVRSLQLKHQPPKLEQPLSRLVLVEHDCDDTEHKCAGKPIDSEWIDTNILETWKTSCHGNHGYTGTVNIEELKVNPGLLIDTVQMCLIETPPYQSFRGYVALSYVWGDALAMKTTKTNLEELKSPGVLAHAMQDSRLPQTISDAITITRILGERYLWVDALCIPQDDHERMSFEIKHMPVFYSRAILTIIAAQGDNANHGICGIKEVQYCRPLQRSRHIYDVDGLFSLVDCPCDNDLSTTVWARRGWTFQEAIFSSRRLIFTNQGVSWECDKGVRFEGVDPYFEHHALIQTDHPSSSVLRLNITGMRWPDLHGYATIVNAFNVRDFSYTKDALFAFFGISYMLGAIAFDDGFHFGLPEAFFDMALLWTPRNSTALTRRTSTSSDLLAADWTLPSWTWMGWQGPIYMPNWYRELETDPGNDERQLCEPMVWTHCTVDYCISPSFMPYTNKIRATGMELLQRRSDEKTFRHRWSHTTSQATRTYGDGTPAMSYRFKHELMDGAEFWSPFPIPSQISYIGETWLQGKDSRYLSFCTRQAFLYCTGNPYVEEDIRNDHAPGASLRDATGAWVGYISFTDSATTSPRIWTPSHGSWTKERISRTRIGLIEISRGHVLEVKGSHRLPTVDGPVVREVPEFYHQERPRDKSKPYEFYNVLWVEWEDGVAYRKGLGRVMKSVWEAEATKRIDVTLG